MFKEKVLQIHYIVFCLLSCFPLLGLSITSLCICLFVLLSLTAGFASPKQLQTGLVPELLIYLLLFVMILVRTAVFEQTPEAYFYLERSLSLLVFPLAFFFLPVQYSGRQKNLLLFFFFISTLIIVSWSLISIGLKLYIHPELLNGFPFYYLVRTLFEDTSHLHPTYASIYLGISFLLLFNWMLKSYINLTFRGKTVCFTLLLLIIIMQITLASRTPFIGTILAGTLLFFLFLKKKIYALLAVVLIVILCSLFFLLLPSFSTRYKEISLQNTAAPTLKTQDSFNIRIGIMKCSKELLKENWLLGLGPGHVQQKLNDCYDGISKEVYQGNNYNTHNQFMDYWLGMGILAPLSLLLIFIYFAYKNWKRRCFLPLSICLLLFISMMTENILIRQNGIVAFSYFMGLYSFAGNTKKQAELFGI